MPLLDYRWLRKCARLGACWSAIIGALLVVFALGGCSAVRLSYNNAPNLALWWLDGYFDFDSDQSARMRTDLQGLQTWHRAQELPLFVEVFKNLQASAAQSVSADQVCKLYAYLQTRVQIASDHLVPPLASLAPTLQAAQLDHVAREFDKRNRLWREEWMDGTPADATERRFKQLVERAESFYGRLDPEQLAVVRTQIRTAGFDATLHYREILRRQQDALQTLRELRTGGMTDPLVQAQFRALMARTFTSPDPVYRQYMTRLTGQSCAAVAALHNSTTVTQRLRLAQTLQDYENDVRALLAP
jgi:hypothetical protein